MTTDERRRPLPAGDPTAGLLELLLRITAGTPFELTIGHLRLTGLYGGQTATVAKPGMTEMAPVLVVPNCTCGGPDDFDPECWRHGTRDPEEAEVLALLPVVRQALTWQYGPWTAPEGQPRLTAEENRWCNVLSAVLRELTRPTATPADGSALEWPPPLILEAEERREQAILRQGFRDAADIVLRALRDLQAEGETFDAAADRIRKALAEGGPEADTQPG